MANGRSGVHLALWVGVGVNGTSVVEALGTCEGAAELEMARVAFKERDPLLAAQLAAEDAKARRDVEVLEHQRIIGIRTLTARSQLISALPENKAAAPEWSDPSVVSSEETPLLGVALATWQGSDGCSQASVLLPSHYVQLARIVRLTRLIQPMVCDGQAFSHAVEIVETENHDSARGVLGRFLFRTEEAARQQYSIVVAKCLEWRKQVWSESVSKTEEEMSGKIGRIRELMESAHDSAARARHQRTIERLSEELKREKAQRVRQEAEKEKERAEWRRWVQLLVDAYFPRTADVRRRLAEVTPVKRPAWIERLREALTLDHANLGIYSPGYRLQIHPQLVREYQKALRAKTPVRRAYTEAVLNWLSAGYKYKPQREWIAEITNKLHTKINPRSFAESVRKRFGPKSALRGRPETK